MKIKKNHLYIGIGIILIVLIGIYFMKGKGEGNRVELETTEGTIVIQLYRYSP